MKGFCAFFAKEICACVRSKRLLLILGVFLIVGIMNPAVAKLTPKLYEMMSEELAAQGLTIGAITVTALDSWGQFAKNFPTALIAVIIIFSGIYTTEYSKGTLIPLLTKGLSRSAAVLSKCAVMLLLWSAGTVLCFGVTYFYSDFYWDNSVVSNLAFAAFCWWLFGVLMIACIVFFSSFAGSAGQVLLGTGGVYLAMTLAGMARRAQEYLPTYLCGSAALYTGKAQPSDYAAAAVITAAAAVLLTAAALPLTRRRQL